MSPHDALPSNKGFSLLVMARVISTTTTEFKNSCIAKLVRLYFMARDEDLYLDTIMHLVQRPT